MAGFVAALVEENRLTDGTYVEPYAGGAAIAWELLLTGLVRRVEINDISRPIHALWWSVLKQPEAFCRKVRDCELDLATWDRCKAVFRSTQVDDLLELGFAAFFLNRTNRSGILNGGVIGGRTQHGQWKIDARFNRAELIARIERIARVAGRVRLDNMDAVEFLRAGEKRWSPKTLVYLDPPYFLKGGQLYYDAYVPGDHATVAAAVGQHLKGVSWIVSYDDVEPIRGLYANERMLRYTIGYSARDRGLGAEAMFFAPQLRIPAVRGSMIEVERSPGVAA